MSKSSNIRRSSFGTRQQPGCKTFTEEDSPFYRSFLIAYSKQEDFTTYSLAMVNFYMKEVIGLYYPENYEYNVITGRFLTGDDEYSITSWTRLY